MLALREAPQPSLLCVARSSRREAAVLATQLRSYPELRSWKLKQEVRFPCFSCSLPLSLPAACGALLRKQRKKQATFRPGGMVLAPPYGIEAMVHCSRSCVARVQAFPSILLCSPSVCFRPHLLRFAKEGEGARRTGGRARASAPQSSPPGRAGRVLRS